MEQYHCTCTLKTGSINRDNNNIKKERTFKDKIYKSNY